ncbi:hypothetical protein KM043_011791 [Ampulex compressa]|nr:hypothetical protein KM043_011791 [Ampulex compressa]
MGRCGSIRFSAIVFVLYCRANYIYGQDYTTGQKSVIPSQITVTSWNDMPFSGIAKENGEWIGKGYAFYILDLISNKLNFTYNIVPPDAHVLGNTKTGILGLLYEKKVDMAVAFLPALPEMRQYCSFSTALDETQLTALMKRPQESATGSGLLAPFDQTVWLLVLGALILMGPVIYFFAFIRGRLWNDPESENYSLPSCMWFAYSSLLKQGTDIIAVTDSTRMLFATWWIFILILTSFYTANLTAFLTKPQFTLPINSLKDIVHRNYKWVTYKGRTVDFLLSQYRYNELSLLNKTKSKGKFIPVYEDNGEDILKEVDNRKLFLGDSHYFQTLIFEDYMNKTLKDMDHGHRCTYVIMPGGILLTDSAFGFPLGSPIEGTINKELLRLVEAGIIKHIKDKDLPMAELVSSRVRNNGNKSNTPLCCPQRKKPTERHIPTPNLPVYKINEYPHEDPSKLPIRSPPPIYQDIQPNLPLKKQLTKSINGQNYYVVVDRNVYHPEHTSCFEFFSRSTALSKEFTMQLHIRGQHTAVIESHQDETIQQIKERLAHLEGIENAEFNLYCKGALLADDIRTGDLTSDVLELTVPLPGGKVHGSLARAGKVKAQTPKVEKQEKSKKKTGRAKRRIQYNRRTSMGS